MGLLTFDVIRLLSLFKEKGIEKKSLCLIGKQDIHIEWAPFMEMVAKFEFHYDREIYKSIRTKKKIDAYSFFRMFGFTEVHAVDVSPFEGADIILNLAGDLPENLRSRFDYIVDGGTIEHVFDIAKAVSNIADMVKVGGYIIHITPMAGMVDHGFYNVSPIMFLEFYHANSFNIKALDMAFVFGKETSFKKQVCVFSQDCRMFPGWNQQITEYVKMVNQIQEIMSVLCWCVVERKEQSSSCQYPIQGVYDSRHIEYAEKSTVDHCKEDAVDFLKAHCDKRVALYCTGEVCNLLLDELYKNDMDHIVQYLFNSNPARAGTVQRGYKIYYPTKSKLDNVDMILICTDKYDDEIHSFLVKNGVGEEKLFRVNSDLEVRW